MKIPLFETFRSQHVLITGGLGFVGSNLAARLLDLGAEVTILDSLASNQGGNWFNVAAIKNRITIVVGDIGDKAVVSPLVKSAQYLFNLAGQGSHLASIEDPETDLSTNTVAQLALLQACRQHNPGLKIVFAGTRQVYGRPKYLPVDEGHPLEPVDFNGVTKLAGEMYHLNFHRLYGMRTTCLRLTNTYGPRMRVQDGRLTFIGLWFRRLVEGKPLDIFGDGSNLRVFTYVDDVVDAFLLAAANPAADGEIFNLGSDEPIRLIDVAHLMISIHGGGSYRLLPFTEQRKKIDIGSYYADYSKINSRLGWKPSVTLAEGIKMTLEYYRENIRRYLFDEVDTSY